MNPETRITIGELREQRDRYVLVDVRKAHARRVSGITIPDAERRSVFDAEHWWREYVGRRPVLFCVHGHEVSRAGCGYLRDNGIEAHYLEGGFEAWREAGLAVAPIGDADQ